MSENNIFQEAKKAFKQGDKHRAKDLLTRLLQKDKSNPDYWFWMSGVVKTRKEQIFCLKKVHELDPQNHWAQQGLIFMGELEPDQSTPHPIFKREKKWIAPQVAGAPPINKGFPYFLAQISLHMWTSIGVLVILTLLITSMLLYGRNFIKSREPVLVSRFIPTMTLTPVSEVGFQSLKTDLPGEQSLNSSLSLKITYTPTPRFVNRDHFYEAYRSGILAHQRQEWEMVIHHMQELLKLEPDAVDAYYYIGEAYLFLQDHIKSIQAFGEALKLDASFGPAYYGIAKAKLSQDPQMDILDDLDTAIQYEPEFGEAYLERAKFHISKENFPPALEDLDSSIRYLPDSPLPHLFRAQVYLSMDEYDKARKEASIALERDFTLLPAYAALGESLIGLGKTQDGIQYLEVYTAYAPADYPKKMTLAIAYLQAKSYSNSIIVLNELIDEDPGKQAYFYNRGLIYLEMGDAESALKDFNTANRLNSGSFNTNMGIGKALYELGFYGDAYIHFNQISHLAQTNREKASLYYHRAFSLEGLNETKSAILEWQRVLDLPRNEIPQELFSDARNHYQLLTASTSTFTPTSTLSPTPTTTDTSTLTPSPTPSLTTSPTSTPSPSPTLTNTITPTMTPIWVPEEY